MNVFTYVRLLVHSRNCQAVPSLSLLDEVGRPLEEQSARGRRPSLLCICRPPLHFRVNRFPRVPSRRAILLIQRGKTLPRDRKLFHISQIARDKRNGFPCNMMDHYSSLVAHPNILHAENCANRFCIFARVITIYVCRFTCRPDKIRRLIVEQQNSPIYG